MSEATQMPDEPPLDAIDRRLVRATQGGLPLTPRPYHAIAEQLGLTPAEVMDRLEGLLASGIIRRIGAVPNHYALGYAANGMSVWDVADGRVDDLGAAVGGLDFVSHCYRRPRRLPLWPYNLFAMVHGRDRDEVTAKVARIKELLGEACQQHDIIYSTAILKKTGLRLGR
ncbi:MAG: AsnC family transcriptional regulator [Alphaproteobacteria bacterium]|jgi:DNA-binding Lrp family transcriptional regulator|nr:AsnC family transcriptional regulator [Alphaproteobacteria bacterium]